MKRKTIDIITLGCSKNLVDSEHLMRQLEEAGYHVTHDTEKPEGEIAVINTCGFIGDAKEESINMILEFAQAKEEGDLEKLYVMGCLSERYLKELAIEIPQVDKFYGKFNWVELLQDLGKAYHEELHIERTLTTPRHYAYLKISEGCDRKCSYCAIPIITGKHVSRPMEEILDEVRYLVSKGVKEFQVIAQELTYYGIDLYKKQMLPELIERISEIPGVEWIRLHYAYPAHFPTDLFRVMRERDNVCKYMDIALQHISDNMLKLMRRQVGKEDTYKLIEQFRKEVPGIHLRTTLMVGHPGETEEDFEELKDALIADALPKNIAGLQRDLGKYRITYDVWFHESDLHKSGAVDDVIKILMDKGACYKAEDGAIMYRSAQYASKYGVVNRKKDENADGEEEAKDEVLVRANGIPTYFAADIAYHYNKLAVRGFDRAIDIWGADHHGHVARMKGAMDAVGLDGTKLDVVLMQMVNLMRDGKPVRMSKRTGKAITLTDLLDEVPIDSARFFFNQRESSSTLDFDLDLAVRNDSENPVYYVQYAHARICSVLKKLEAAGVTFEGADALDASLLTDPSEQALLRLLSAFPAEIAAAAEKYDPARITRYVIDIATAFHRFYNACRILEADPAVRQCRMALCLAVRSVIRNVLTMFKVTVPESM